MKQKLKSYLYALSFLSVFVAGCKKDEIKDENASVLPNQSIVKASSTGISGTTATGGGNFSFTNTGDLAIPFYFSNIGAGGPRTGLICYRPGSGTVQAFANYPNATPGQAPNFSMVFSSTTGVGGYNMLDPRDRIVPFDYFGVGKNSALFCYRPGGNAWRIVIWNSSTFINITSGTDIGTWVFTDARDQVISFDWFGTGHQSELLFYRPGTGKVCIIKNLYNPATTPAYVPVYNTTTGVGAAPYNYNLTTNGDLINAWDFNGTGHKDGLLIYRPGQGIVAGYTHTQGQSNFNVFQFYYSGLPSYQTFGTRPYDLLGYSDRITSFDFPGTNSTNGAFITRAGARVAYGYSRLTINENILNYYSPSSGIGSGSNYYDLSTTSDKVFGWDGDNIGKLDHLVCYRPGTGAFWIFNSGFQKIY